MLIRSGYETIPERIFPPLLRKPASDEAFEWLLEDPQKYDRFGVAHRDLDRLVATLDKIRKFAELRGETVRTVHPHAWKGNVPKPAHHARVLAALSAVEKTRVDQSSHDQMDAVALGLFGVGRLGRGGTKL